MVFVMLCYFQLLKEENAKHVPEKFRPIAKVIGLDTENKTDKECVDSVINKIKLLSGSGRDCRTERNLSASTLWRSYCENDEVISTGYVGAPRGRKNCSDLGICIRQKMNVPRGERYELAAVCMQRRMHHQCFQRKNDRKYVISGWKEVDTGEYVKNSNSCSMCKRMIINAGIDRVYIRDSKDEYRMIHVQQWIDDDESLAGTFGYLIRKRTKSKIKNRQKEKQGR